MTAASHRPPVLNFIRRTLRSLDKRIHALYLKTEHACHPPVHYHPGQDLPWSPGYIEARTEFTANVLADAELLAKFYAAAPGFLPTGYGIGLDERCVEWPWAVAHFDDVQYILDAGSALNHQHLLSLPVLKKRTLHIYTFAPEPVCEWQRSISYIFGDLRKTPYQNAQFDLVVSISTLEHIGMDNVAYSGQHNHKEHIVDDIFLALAEWKRILKPGGKILFSVPYGIYQDHGSFQQFDANLLEKCAHYFSPKKRNEAFFLYTVHGWQATSQNECASEVYALNADKVPNSDFASAARAVACCEWWV